MPAESKYRVLTDTSTRKSPDPGSPEYEEWLRWEAGDTVTSWPDHLPVDQLVADGHWEPVAKRTRKSADEEAAS